MSALRSHDYEFEWDYEVVQPTPAIADLITRSEALIRSEVMPALAIADLRITCVADLDGDLGRYVSGTNSMPYIALDIEALEQACFYHQLDLEQQITATIVHELGHAFQEAQGHDHADHSDAIEDEAEAFARCFVLNNEIRVDLLRRPDVQDHKPILRFAS